ncbi:MAG: hypothetical protein ABIT36_01295 [Steroidobacteraceae bacterium]
MRLVLPLILLNIISGNQLWMIGPLFVGQIILWFAVMICGVAMLGYLGGRVWIYVLLLTIPLSRVMEALTGSPTMTLLYLISLNSVFFMSGIIAATREPDLVFRQVRTFLVACVPMMFLQVAGAGSWTQALNTEYWVDELQVGKEKEVYPTLFRTEENIKYGVGQGRPAGFLHANNVLSLVIIFGFVLQMGRWKDKHVSATDLVIVATMVLAMAKIVIAAFLIMVLYMLVNGDSTQRSRVWRLLLVTAICYGVYAFLFPGLFAMQLSVYKIMYSITVRLTDMLAAFTALDASQQAAILDLLGDASFYNYASESDVGGLSGYASILMMWPLLLGAMLIGIPVFWLGARKLRKISSRRELTAWLALIAVVMFPAAVPFFRAQLYWFVFGFAAVPLIALLMPRTSARLLKPSIIARRHAI